MKRSEQINELAAALSKAQKDFEAAERGHIAKVETRKGGSYSFNYADLASYLDVCREPLGSNGLSFIQEPIRKGNEVTVTTLLLHSSGQWIESEPLIMTITGQGEDSIITPQAVGSAITYARRYSLSAMIGMASEVDDDGNTASGNRAETGKREPLSACPHCGKTDSVIVGKPEYGGGFLCFAKKQGCGHKWQAEQKPADAPVSNHTDSFKVWLAEIPKPKTVAGLQKLFKEFSDKSGCTEDEEREFGELLDQRKAELEAKK